jgi:hypothetical protein
VTTSCFATEQQSTVASPSRSSMRFDCEAEIGCKYVESDIL